MRFLAGLFAFFCFIAPVSAAPVFPALTGRVVDGANLLTPETRSRIDAKLAALEAQTSRQLIVVTLASLNGYEISDYGYQLGRHWGIGQARLNNGVLFLIAPNEHKTRIEVGYGLEPILTDAFTSLLLQNAVLPKFRAGDFEGGVADGVDALVAQMSLERSAAEARVAAAQAQSQSGASGHPDPIGVLIAILFIAFAIFRVFGGWGFLPFLFLGGGGGGGGGGYGGGGYGGGGFGGGGGGSFGGGGASGSW